MTTAMQDAPERLVEFPALKEEREKLNAKRDSLAGIMKEAGPAFDMSLVKSINGDTQAKVEEIRKLNKEIDDCKSEVDKLLVVARAAAVAKEHEDGKANSVGGADKGPGPQFKDGKRKSFGDMISDSDAIKGYKPGSGQGPSASIDVDLKALLKADFTTSAGWDPQDIRTSRVEMFATRPAPHVVNFIPTTETTQSAIVYMEEITFTNSAAEAAEGGAYGEAALVLTEKTSAVRKVAVFLPVTDEQFEDEPRSRDYVNNRLPFMLRQRLDLQVLIGNGTAPNLLGVENVTGIQTQALGTDSITDAIYKAMRKIRDDGFAEPSTVFIRPSKWESVRLLKTADGVYIWGHPSAPGPMTIWGVPVVETTAVTETKAVIGDFANFSELSIRRGLDVQVSNSHASFFTTGKLAVRADVRVAFVVYRPKAMAVVTGL